MLPISNKSTRIRISPKKEEKTPSKRVIPQKDKESVKKQDALNLQDIPITEFTPEQDFSTENEVISKNLNSTDFEEPEKSENLDEPKEILKEITPRPFKGSIIAEKSIFGIKSSAQTPTNASKEEVIKDSELESNLIKQKQLEKDMTKVLKFLSKKVTVKPLEELRKTPEPVEKPPSQIPPSSMNEILTNLLKLDLHIEASAIIQNDGTILASATSSRMSDSLFSTIAQNLSMIGHDIIEGLSAGKLMNISIRGSEGVLDLAPIDIKGKVPNEMVLIIFSHPKLKMGIIHLAADIVKKQVIQYLGINK